MSRSVAVTNNMPTSPSPRYPLALLTLVSLAFIWSGIHPKEYFTWALEVFPVVLSAVLLLATFRRFRLTNLLYTLIAMHMLVLLVGGHYTYGEVPLFNWIRDTFHQSRNNYDRPAHFFQGFVPAILAREILIRSSPLKGSKWLPFVVVCICLAFSACYELFEWQVSIWTGSGGDAFLGTQGDIWDTQKDMAMALVGATCAVCTMGKWHDRGLRKLQESK